jgi:predicted nucleic acid-binding protein
MPAVERSFADALPESLYLDTDIIVAGINRSHPNHQRAAMLLVRMAAGGGMRVIISSLTWIEFLNVITRPMFRDALPSDLRQRLRLGRWHDAMVRQTYVRAMLARFEGLLAQFDYAEIPMTISIRNAAIQLAIAHNLRAQDAVHLASAQHSGVSHLASFDEAFRRVDGIHLWNDLIHGTRTQQ